MISHLKRNPHQILMLDNILYPHFNPPSESPQEDKALQKEVKKKIKDMKGSKKEPKEWDPHNYSSFDATIDSISLFIDFKNDEGEKMTKKEIRTSFDNLDEWIEEMAVKYQEEQKLKENKALA